MNDVIRTVRLDGLEDRRPDQLSGGQQQRVALARALINRPAALLLDEPLGALDLKLRKEMQLELKELQQRTETTFVYVTHDQEEAMTMSDRIAVMNLGVVEQLATPRELYQRPASAFVAGFIGTSNLIDLRVDRARRRRPARDGPRRRAAHPRRRSRVGSRRRSSDDHGAARVDQARERHGERSAPRTSAAPSIDVVYLGSITQLIVLLRTGERLTVHRLNDEVGAVEPRPGEPVMLRWAAEHSYIVGSEPGGGARDGVDVGAGSGRPERGARHEHRDQLHDGRADRRRRRRGTRCSTGTSSRRWRRSRSTAPRASTCTASTGGGGSTSAPS